MLDLRLPIGVYFLINCVILVAVGIMTPLQTKVGDQSINLNLVWGIVMGVFGAFMLGLIAMDKKKQPPMPHKVVEDPQQPGQE